MKPGHTTLRARLDVMVLSKLSVLALIAAVALSTNAVAAPTVSPEAYASSVCAAVATSHSIVEEAGSGPFRQAGLAFARNPTRATAGGLRDALVTFMQQTRAAFRGILTAAKRAGTPSETGGAEFARAFIQEARATTLDADALVKEARALDVSSTARFKVAYKAFSTHLDAISDASRARAARESAYQNAPEALRPLVEFLTTAAPVCQDEAGSDTGPSVSA